MKQTVLNIILVCTLLIFVGCEKPSQKKEIEKYSLECDMVYVSFEGMYLDNYLKDEVFLIKGVALDVCEYDNPIEIIEDLKGNFDDTSLIYVQKMDAIIQYHENDTLIMLIKKVDKRNYYITLTGCSVLKLSNGYVDGYINKDYGSKCINEIETMLWEELQKKLQELLNIT